MLELSKQTESEIRQRVQVTIKCVRSKQSSRLISLAAVSGPDQSGLSACVITLKTWALNPQAHATIGASYLILEILTLRYLDRTCTEGFHAGVLMLKTENWASV